jgi:2-methylcitrate dehydratase PrpD
MAESLTPHLAQFVVRTRYDDIPSDVLEKGKGHILDSLGCGLAGSVSDPGKIALAYLADECGSDGAASVLGTASRFAPRFAAFANGLAMHADDFDDTGPQPSPDRNGGIHATVPVLAVALALSERDGRSGKEFMAALHVGVEVSCKLNHAADQSHYSRGYHSTCSIGIFGATAAAAHLLGLGEEATARAFGIAASQSCGLRANFGSMMNPFHAGHAAECGLVSARFAARGFTSTPGILEKTPIGYFQAAAGGFDPDAIMGRLGKPWAFVDPGMWIKPYPCGALTHPAITALIDLAKTHDIKPDEIASVSVKTNQNMVNTLIHNRPKSELQAKFSMPFAAAVALQRRRVTLAEFNDAVVLDAEVQALIAKVDYSAFEKREEGYSNVTTLMEVALTDGREFSLRADFGKGSPRNPMSYDDLAEKFRGCAGYANWAEDKAEAVIEIIRDLENVPLMSAVTRLLVREGGGTA